MMERAKIFVEPSAAVPLAVVLFNENFREKIAQLQRAEGSGRAWDVGIVLSGGNTTMAALSKLFAEGERKESKDLVVRSLRWRSAAVRCRRGLSGDEAWSWPFCAMSLLRSL